MKKSHGPSQKRHSSNAAENFESDRQLAAPDFNPSAIVQTKTDSSASSNFKSGGEKLPDALQTKMEGSFDSNFSNVKINTNSPEASSMGAKAFAQGNEISFSPGAYQPETQKGQKLIGHELTHVVQQRNANIPTTTQFSGLNINQDESLEREADQMGILAAQGKKTGMSSSNQSTNQPVAQGFGFNKGIDFMKKVKEQGAKKVGGVANKAKGKGREAMHWGRQKARPMEQFAKKGINFIESGVKSTLVEGAGRMGLSLPDSDVLSLDFVRHVVNFGLDKISHFISKVLNTRLSTKLRRYIAKIKDFAKKVVDPAQIFAYLKKILVKMIHFLVDTIRKAKDKGEDVLQIQKCVHFLRQLTSKLKGTIADAPDLLEIILNIMQDSSSDLQDDMTFALNAASEISNNVHNTATDVISNI